VTARSRLEGVIAPEPRPSAPRARISRGALTANIAAALADRPDALVDLRRDACGHGAALVEAAARDAGAAGFRRDGDRADPAEVLDPAVVFGLTAGRAPAMSLVAPVLSVKPLLEGEGVSYGYRHRADRDTHVALVAAGYAHGVPRAVGGAATVRIGAAEHRIVGRVAMDVCVVDIGACAIEPGDTPVFFGREHPSGIERWAGATGLSALELVAAVGLHVAREVVP